ncbi:hypothetical protein [Massilia sp. S19_KUP03_FR1]|uniref:hypothetical protein n=1 Tax=Massilia sp. S19_KUP03_FR1 TaxID=3025503 RepID=UPI002FCD74BD
MADHTTMTASTPAPVAALAQSRDTGAAVMSHAPPATRPGHGQGYAIAPNLTRTVASALPPQRGLPLYRPLRIFTLDPTVSARDGGVSTVNVAYEALHPGPDSRLFHIDPHDPVSGEDTLPADLDAPYPLLSGGYDPAASDARFHKQMLYAVCSNVYAAFRVALGRELTWGFERDIDPGRLWLQPHAFRGINAYYNKGAGRLCFGYEHAPELNDRGVRMLPGEYVFTCLGHDIIAHEMTHALLDGLRSSFDVPSSADVPAFHEAFADLIAIFQRLGCPQLVRSAIVGTRGAPEQNQLLVTLARQAGYASGHNQALRAAIDLAQPRLYDDTLEAHDLGAVLVAAVFDAFLVVFRRKTARYLRLASDGSGVLRAGELAPDLADMLAEEISALASQFQALIIRAIDYCPPVDIRFGEFLRAMITADIDLVPDDPWGYREALVDAFLRRAIVPRGVRSLSEQSLLWGAPQQAHEALVPLSFAKLQFAGDPGCPADSTELLRQAHALGAYVAQPQLAEAFGLVHAGMPGLSAGAIGLPTVMSIRSARRIGPARQIVFDLVAEVVQRCQLAGPGGASFPVDGGCTVIIGPDGAIRYIISKSVLGAGRLARRAQFLAGPAGQRYWQVEAGAWRPRDAFFSMLHAEHGVASRR